MPLPGMPRGAPGCPHATLGSHPCFSPSCTLCLAHTRSPTVHLSPKPLGSSPRDAEQHRPWSPGSGDIPELSLGPGQPSGL